VSTTEGAPDSSADVKPALAKPSSGKRVVLITGMAGAGRSTALKALEDIGYEAVDNLPLKLLPALIREAGNRPVANLRARPIWTAIAAGREPSRAPHLRQ